MATMGLSGRLGPNRTLGPLGNPGLDLAAVWQLCRNIPPFMEDAQNLDFLVPISGSRVHAVEQRVGMGGGGAKVAG